MTADSLNYRLGSYLKRQAIYEVARRWNLKKSFRVSVVDAWKLTDNRPETSFEGRHWVIDQIDDRASRRPLIGEAEGMRYSS